MVVLTNSEDGPSGTVSRVSSYYKTRFRSYLVIIFGVSGAGLLDNTLSVFIRSPVLWNYVSCVHTVPIFFVTLDIIV